jgi:hypothetical protein
MKTLNKCCDPSQNVAPNKPNIFFHVGYSPKQVRKLLSSGRILRKNEYPWTTNQTTEYAFILKYLNTNSIHKNMESYRLLESSNL